MTSRQLTIGVIGHVDHGKSALVRALTGMETDRLAEEQQRGMSIVLGFAWLQRGDLVFDFIDVPGHENFIRTMVSGATGIDGVLLVVDACEGVMPQTREHLMIAQLLGIERGVVAITKTDLADEELIAACRAEIAEVTAGTFLAAAPVLAVSAVTGQGLDALVEILSTIANTTAAPVENAGWYLPVDRSFSADGFGTVVTGTLRRGALAVGDDVAVLPAGKTTAVRALQVHGENVVSAAPGQRVAVNLRGIDRETVPRGVTLCAPESLGVGTWLDILLELPRAAPQVLANSMQLRLLKGTAEVNCRLRLLDCDSAQPGTTAFAQLHCATPVAACAGEHFVLRTLSPPATVAGGRVLLSGSARRRRHDQGELADLARLRDASLAAAVGVMVEAAGEKGITRATLAASLGAARPFVEAVTGGQDAVVHIGDRLVSKSALDGCEKALLTHLAVFHRDNPAAAGIGAAALIEACATGPTWLFDAALQSLATAGRLRMDAGLVRLDSHDGAAGLSAEERKLADAIEALFFKELFSPPDRNSICTDPVRTKMLDWLLEQRRLRRLRCSDTGKELVFHDSVVTAAIARIESAYPAPQPFRVSEVRELLQTTRKYLLPLLGYLDSQGITIRDGDFRRLRYG